MADRGKGVVGRVCFGQAPLVLDRRRRFLEEGHAILFGVSQSEGAVMRRPGLGDVGLEDAQALSLSICLRPSCHRSDPGSLGRRLFRGDIGLSSSSGSGVVATTMHDAAAAVSAAGLLVGAAWSLAVSRPGGG